MQDDQANKPRVSAEAPPLTPALLRPLLQTIAALSRTIENRDSFTSGHQSRVSALARSIAQALALPMDQVEAIRIAGTLHDLGMSAVPLAVLAKPGLLDAAERRLVERHVGVTAEVLEGIAFPWPVAAIVRQHHERLDGSGYPAGLKGEAIGIEARIVAVADVFESLRAARPHRPAFDAEAALAVLAGGAGTLYDPAVVAACRRVIKGDGEGP